MKKKSSFQKAYFEIYHISFRKIIMKILFCKTCCETYFMYFRKFISKELVLRGIIISCKVRVRNSISETRSDIYFIYSEKHV